MTIFSNLTPLKWAQELVVIAVILVALCFIVRYKKQIIILLTGDDKIHMDILDCCYCTFCRCCNMCDGEWTRCLTSCPCCPRWLYGRNFVKEFARCMGFYQTIIEVKNIVVGDLPYDKSVGDFYITIGVGTNPDMVTALQESKYPKVVHFPEILQLKVRHNILEPRVHIMVKELNVIGSEHLCEVVLSANAMVDWMREKDKPMRRFQMRPLNDDIERETPPWICLEFSEPSENRDIDTIPTIDMWAAPGDVGKLQVRTWEKSMDHGNHPGTMPGNRTAHGGSQVVSKYADGTAFGTRELKKRSIKDMKGMYTLLDDSGNPIQEPSEESLDKIRCRRNCLVFCFHGFNCLVFLAVIVYMFFRFYIWSCYRQFRFLTMAILNKQPLPISNSHLHDIVAKCHDKIRGTGIQEGMDACRPNASQTLYVCENLPKDNRPEAFVTMAYDWFGLNIQSFAKDRLGCFDGICKFRDNLVQWDYYIAAGAICLVLLTCVFRCCANYCIKQMRKNAQRNEGQKILATRNLSPEETKKLIP